MKFFWQILIFAEALALLVLIRYWWHFNTKKVNHQIISYRERLRFRRVSRLCCCFILGGIISALILFLNL
jgi:hypothetical protein